MTTGSSTATIDPGAVETIESVGAVEVDGWPSFPPGKASLASGHVSHLRTTPVDHRFTNAVSYVWIDPDTPSDVCRAHPLWSARRPSPVRFRRRDFGSSPTGSLADAARADLAAVVGAPPSGPVRMLTQLRRWGWLFNPITVYVVWDGDSTSVAQRGVVDEIGPVGPVGAVLEVTSTPWKQRIRYPIALTADGAGWWTARTDKAMHVSPFLDEDYQYDVRLRGDGRRIELRIDVVRSGHVAPTVRTALDVRLEPPTRRALGRALRQLSTHRVSFDIHRQAMRLWWKRVPFVPHPTRRR